MNQGRKCIDASIKCEGDTDPLLVAEELLLGHLGTMTTAMMIELRKGVKKFLCLSWVEEVRLEVVQGAMAFVTLIGPNEDELVRVHRKI